MSLVGKVAIVTGAAQGIGLGVAHNLAMAGASVLLNDINFGQGRFEVEKLRGLGLDVRYRNAEVCDDEEVNCLVDKCVEDFGRLDIVINNAAKSNRSRRRFRDQDAEVWASDCNFLEGYMLVARAAAPYLRMAGGGAIVNMSSSLARFVAHESCSYHVAKAGIEQLTRYLAHELGPENIRVNAVAPGLVDRDVGIKLSDNPDNQAVIGKIVPLRRAASSQDIAHLVTFLCSDISSYITGQTIVIDGGLSVCEAFGVGIRMFQQGKDVAG